MPDEKAERWGIVVANKSGEALETAAAYRTVRAEAGKYYAAKEDARWLKELVVGATDQTSRLRDLMRAEGYTDDDILTTPDNIGGRYAVFTPVGLLPAAVIGLDVRALLLGAATMTKRFLEEPFDRNPVLQYAAVNHLMTEEFAKSTRVLTVWGRKLAGIGQWYDNVLGESLGRAGKGPTPVTVVATRDLYSRGQLAPGRPAEQDGQQPVRPDGPAPADHGGHGRQQRGRPERVQPEGLPGPDGGRVPRDQPGLRSRPPGRPRTSSCRS